MTPSGSDSRAASRWSGSTTWWLCSPARRWASARACRDRIVNLSRSMSASLPRQAWQRQGHQLAAALLLEHPGDLAAAAPLSLEARQHLLELLASSLHLQLELHDHLDPREVDAPLGELLDHAQAGDVALGVPAGVPRRPGRMQQALPLVDPEGLGMHSGELRGHADDVDSSVLAPLLPLVHRLHPSSHASPRRPRGLSPAASCSCFRSCFSSLDRREGTSTWTVTMRSPLPPRRLGTPLPRIRNVRPEVVPAGTLRVTVPFIVGTWTWAPSAASGYVTGSVSRRSDPRRPKNRWGPTRTTTYKSPGLPPGGPASPRPPSRIRAPSSTPAGTFTRSSRSANIDPLPPQVAHGCSMTWPRPAHLAHVWVMENSPCSTATTPLPEHSGQVRGWVPGLAPLPPQVVQGLAPETRSGTVVPVKASSNGTLTSASRSAPRRGAVRPPRPPRPPPPNRSNRSPNPPTSKPRSSKRTPPPPPPGPKRTPPAAISRTRSYSLRRSPLPRTS